MSEEKKSQMTVMEEIRAIQAERKAFQQTKAGGAFYRFESAIGKAWVTDQNINASRKAMDRDWKAAEVARQELIAAIKELQASAGGDQR